jgi:predicted permease
MKCIRAVNSVNKTNRNRYNSVLKISCKILYCQLKQLLLLILYNPCSVFIHSKIFKKVSNNLCGSTIL